MIFVRWQVVCLYRGVQQGPPTPHRYWRRSTAVRQAAMLQAMHRAAAGMEDRAAISYEVEPC